MTKKKELKIKVSALIDVINMTLEKNITDKQEIINIQSDISFLAREIKEAHLSGFYKKRLMDLYSKSIDEFQTRYYRLIKDNTVSIISNRLLIHRKLNQNLLALYGNEYLKDFKENSIYFDFI